MWGYKDTTSPALLRLHFGLTSRLSAMPWSRIELWDERTSVHEWRIGDSSFAFDVALIGDDIDIVLVTRDAKLLPRVMRGLELELIPVAPIAGRNDRVQLQRFSDEDSNDTLDRIAGYLRKVRTSLALTVHETFTYHDTSTNGRLNFAIKSERKGSKELIFLFSSIRTKPHWIDFNGPYGESLKNLRARVVFISDDTGEEYTYNFCRDNNLSPLKTTVSFIRNYVIENEYNWSNVTLCGLSKGGTSAIIVGSQLPSCTVLALAPQLELGSYLLRSNRHGIIKEMTGRDMQVGASLIDELMWKTLSNSTPGKGIGTCYILTSPNDPDCVAGLGKFNQLYSNRIDFRLDTYIDKSEFTNTHLETVHHLAPLFISVLGLISSGIRPKGIANLGD